MLHVFMLPQGKNGAGFLIGMLMEITIGVCIGALHSSRARRYWQWRLGRKLQLIAARNEMEGCTIATAGQRSKTNWF